MKVVLQTVCVYTRIYIVQYKLHTKKNIHETHEKSTYHLPLGPIIYKVEAGTA